jgi:excisionase family DNA binding protein
MAAARKQYLTTLETANRLMVSPVTVRQWAQKGVLASVSTAGGHRRFMLDEIRRFAEGHGIHFDADGAADAASNTLRVLVVDDDLQHATFIKDLTLSKVPAARVEIASDGFDAGSLAESLRPHLVVLDLNMPRIDGIEVCRRLRARDSTSAARIVLLSGQLTPASIDAVREAGADAWLEKGAPLHEITQALRLNELPLPR